MEACGWPGALLASPRTAQAGREPPRGASRGPGPAPPRAHWLLGDLVALSLAPTGPWPSPLRAAPPVAREMGKPRGRRSSVSRTARRFGCGEV